MKRIIMTGFYLILTLIISAAGFFLPASLSAYQDQQILATIEHPSIEPMELYYSSSLPDTLLLFARGCYFVGYPSTGSSRSPKEVFGIVKDTFRQLEEYGIALFPLDVSESGYNISLQLAIASEDTALQYEKPDTGVTSDIEAAAKDDEKQPLSILPEKNDAPSEKSDAAAGSSDLTTAVVWNCSIYNNYSGYQAELKIDDKSGKIVSFNLNADQSCFHIENKNSLNKLVKAFRKFLRDYYEMKTKAVLQNTVQTNYGIYDKPVSQPSILEAEYIIQLTEESGNLIQIPFTISTAHLSFN